MFSWPVFKFKLAGSVGSLLCFWGRPGMGAWFQEVSNSPVMAQALWKLITFSSGCWVALAIS